MPMIEDIERLGAAVEAGTIARTEAIAELRSTWSFPEPAAARAIDRWKNFRRDADETYVVESINSTPRAVVGVLLARFVRGFEAPAELPPGVRRDARNQVFWSSPRLLPPLSAGDRMEAAAAKPLPPAVEARIGTYATKPLPPAVKARIAAGLARCNTHRGWRTGEIALNLDTVVELLHSQGIAAYVEQTGGGCATIYAGQPRDLGDGHGDAYPAVAGPGWFTGPGFTAGRAALDDFYIGPDSRDGADPDHDWDSTKPACARIVGARNEQDVADLIAAQVEQDPPGLPLTVDQLEDLGFDGTLRGNPRQR